MAAAVSFTAWLVLVLAALPPAHVQITRGSMHVSCTPRAPASQGVPSRRTTQRQPSPHRSAQPLRPPDGSAQALVVALRLRGGSSLDGGRGQGGVSKRGGARSAQRQTAAMELDAEHEVEAAVKRRTQERRAGAGGVLVFPSEQAVRKKEEVEVDLFGQSLQYHCHASKVVKEASPAEKEQRLSVTFPRPPVLVSFSLPPSCAAPRPCHLPRQKLSETRKKSQERTSVKVAFTHLLKNLVGCQHAGVMREQGLFLHLRLRLLSRASRHVMRHQRACPAPARLLRACCVDTAV